MPASSEAASRRRQTRMRREYLYRKSLEGQEKAAYEQKRIIREALASGKPLPTEVRASYDKLKQEVDAEDITTETPKTHIDNEYGDAGLIEPRVRQRHGISYPHLVLTESIELKSCLFVLRYV